MDDGSSVSLINKKFAHLLGSVNHRASLSLVGLNGTRLDADIESVTKVFIRGLHDLIFYELNEVFIVPDLKLPSQSLRSDDVKHFKNQARSVIDFYDSEEPQILIGQDQGKLITTREIIERGNLCLSRTFLGWVVHGLTENTRTLKIGEVLSNKNSRIRKNYWI